MFLIRASFIIISLGFLTFNKPLTAQDQEFYFTRTIIIESSDPIEIKTTKTFTAVSLSLKIVDEIDLTIELDDSIYRPDIDEHYEGDKLNSVPISVDVPINRLKIDPGEYRGELIIHLINGEYKGSKKINRNQKGNCDEPESIPQSEWRSGLPEPNYSRIKTPTSHNIIHHSAGSNTNTNYTQVVRDIYIYHTQVNNWSDIGYNYLIAQNGVIYKGRDPDGFDQDEVQGAHFCGLNSNTMGVCLLGNYSTVKPGKMTLKGLRELLEWKLFKDVLDPKGLEDKGSLKQLPVIAGHRDGCATECPGDHVYELLDSMRNEVNIRVDLCNGIQPLLASFHAMPLEVVKGGSVEFVNTSTGNYDEATWIFVGGNPSNYSGKSPPGITYNQPGKYDVKLAISNDSDTSVYIRESYIAVREDLKVKLTPNPVIAGSEITIISTSDPIKDITVFSITGHVMNVNAMISPFIKIFTGNLNSGLYIVRVDYLNDTHFLKLTVL